MFYIRPPARIMPAAAVRPIGTSDSDTVKEEDVAVSKPADAPFIPTPANDRRKRRDRRNANQDALLETRATKGKDRRKSNTPTISVTV